MNTPTQVRARAAQQLADHYASDPHVELVLLTGSAARNLADAHSDVELHLFWSEPPTDLQRTRPFDLTRATTFKLWPLEEDEWSDTYELQALRFDVSHFHVATVDAYLSATLEHYDPELGKQLLISALQSGLTLYERSPALRARWLSKAADYPQQLRLAMVQAHLQPHPRWAQRHALATRDDWLCLQELLLDTTRRLLAALCGLNGVYVDHPSFKWLGALLPRLRLSPVGLQERLRKLITSPALTAVLELEALLSETCDIVASELAVACAEQAREAFAARRAVISAHLAMERGPDAP